MKKVLVLVILSIIGVLEPALNLMGEDSYPTANYLDNVSLLNKNRDQVYPSNIEYLDKRSPIQLEYNAVIKKYIDFYVAKNPVMVSSLMAKSELYFPLFEEILAKYNLPVELKNIAIIESGLNPYAVSSSGATGLWQILFHTSKMFDMNIDSYVDDRRDPVKATEAACKYFKYLYRIFNDWQLAITAYNCGPGMIEKAIEEAGGKTNYWDIRPFLSLEAQNYYPKFVAATYASSFYSMHGIEVSKPKYTYQNTDKVEIRESVWFKQLAQVLEISVEDLRALNPVYKQDYIPVFETAVSIVLPKNMVKAFHKNEAKIYALRLESKNYHDLRAEVGSTEGKTKVIHTVKRGEYFHTIAMNYDCTIYDIMAWNGMNEKYLNAGQKLVVYVNCPVEQTFVTAQLKPSTESIELLVQN
jgi:membrane-bound lytic murein transglycosylase D